MVAKKIEKNDLKKKNKIESNYMYVIPYEKIQLYG